MLLDSPNLGRRLARLKRLRRRLKPMYVPDEEMCRSCGCPEHATLTALCGRPPGAEPDGPTRFGYFGALGAYAGVQQLIEVFLHSTVDATLEICCYGKAAAKLAERARQTARLKFRGLRVDQNIALAAKAKAFVRRKLRRGGCART